LIAARLSEAQERRLNVNSPEVRKKAGLNPGDNLLFNGWGLTPAGRHVAVSDLALKMVIAPDKRALVAVHGGFNQHGVTLADVAGRKEAQFLPLAKAWNGLTFSGDGKRFFVSGGDSGEIHEFSYADGKAAFVRSVKPSVDEEEIFLAGMAMLPRNEKLCVCNEANNEVWVVNANTLALEKRIAVGQHPHSCVLGEDKRHLYVSNWGSRNVSVVDMERGRRVREINVGIRPNDMTIAPDGRLPDEELARAADQPGEARLLGCAARARRSHSASAAERP